MSTPTISTQRLTLLPTPFDAKRCNYYVDGSNIVIETIPQYLARVTSTIRDCNPVAMLIPKTGYSSLGTYPLASFDATLANFDLRLYAFENGIADGDFKEMWISYLYNFPSLKIGTSTNYTEFETDGTMKMVGDATVWEDENFDAFSAGGPTDPNLTVVDGSGLSLPAFPHDVTKSLQGGREVPHSYKNGTDIVLHVHFMPTTAPANGETVKISVEYYIKRGNTKIATALTAVTYTFTSGALEAWREHRLDLGTVTGTNITMGMQALVKITRTNGDAGTYANPIVVSTFGYHYQKDTVGSRTITSK